MKKPGKHRYTAVYADARFREILRAEYQLAYNRALARYIELYSRNPPANRRAR